MTDEQFRSLCNIYGFAPSRSLRELLDTATAQALLDARAQHFCDTRCTWAEHAPGCALAWTDADADAARLAMELEALLLSTKDTAAVSRWWDSAHDALELHRQRLARAIKAEENT